MPFLSDQYKIPKAMTNIMGVRDARAIRPKPTKTREQDDFRSGLDRIGVGNMTSLDGFRGDVEGKAVFAQFPRAAPRVQAVKPTNKKGPLCGP